MGEEYKIIFGDSSECQKWLNQWKHEFELEILQMCTTNSKIVILLKRKHKQSEPWDKPIDNAG